MKRYWPLFLFFWVACKYDKAPGISGYVTVHLSHTVGTTPYVPGTTYTNAFGETYRLDKFAYYLSNIELLRNGNTAGARETESYHLITAGTTEESFTYSLTETDALNGISLLVGVDSLRNVSGAQTGALDPLNGMFWTWNTGYIMVKMEGVSPQAVSAGNKFEYHIGGFKLPYNNTRRLQFSFPAGREFTPANGDTAHIYINCNIAQCFNGANNFTIAGNPALIHTVIPESAKLANNYATIFSLTNVVIR